MWLWNRNHFNFTPINYSSSFPPGVLGVDIFLVLSGFLIVSVLLKDVERFKRIRFARFYARRAARILPALLLLLLTAWVISFIRSDLIPPPAYHMALVGALTFSLNNLMVAKCTHCHPLTPLWSLSLEEQFYVILPITMAILLRFRKIYIWIPVALLPIIISLVTRYPGCLSLTSTDLCWQYKVSHGSASRFMGQTMGVILGCLWRFGLIDFNSRIVKGWAQVAIFFSLLYFLFASFSKIPTPCIGFDIICFGTIGVIIFAMTEEVNVIKRLLEIGFLRFSGRISYGIYLWHTMTLWIAYDVFSFSLTTRAVIGVAFAYLIASISFYYLERPILRRVTGMLRTS